MHPIQKPPSGPGIAIEKNLHIGVLLHLIKRIVALKILRFRHWNNKDGFSRKGLHISIHEAMQVH